MAEYKQLEFPFMKKEKSLSSKIIDFASSITAGIFLLSIPFFLYITISESIKDYQFKKKDPIAYEKQRLERSINILESRLSNRPGDLDQLAQTSIVAIAMRSLTLPPVIVYKSGEYFLTGRITGSLEKAIVDEQRLKDLKEDYSKIEELERKYKNQKNRI